MIVFSLPDEKVIPKLCFNLFEFYKDKINFTSDCARKAISKDAVACISRVKYHSTVLYRQVIYSMIRYGSVIVVLWYDLVW